MQFEFTKLGTILLAMMPVHSLSLQSAKDDFFSAIFTHAQLTSCSTVPCAHVHACPALYPQTLTPVNLVDFHKSSGRAAWDRLLPYPYACFLSIIIQAKMAISVNKRSI